MSAGAMAKLGHADLGPFGQVRVPRWSAVEDGDRVAADGCFDTDLVAKAGGDPASTALEDLGDVDLAVRASDHARALPSWPWS